VVARAWQAMTTGRPRPAVLVLPQDLMAMESSFSPDRQRSAEAAPRAPLRVAAKRDIDAAAALLASATRPVILAGGGAVWADAAPEIRRLTERLDCPVVTSQQGKGILDERDPHSLGHARSPRGRVALGHANAMMAIGCRFTEVMTGFRKMQVPKRLIQ